MGSLRGTLILWGSVALLVILLLGVAWANRDTLNLALNKLLVSEDSRESAEIGQAGAQSTTEDVEAHYGTVGDADRTSRIAVRRILERPGNDTPLDPDDLADFRTADEQLCLLGVACSSEESLDGAGGPPAEKDARLR